MADAPNPKVTAYVIPHTHWDREWYKPFEVFRARLVDVIDRVLQILDEDPRYRRFTLDGQAIVLEDYLELRPEQRQRLAAHVRAGRLRIGPWYVLADEFLVSPEALVRNLAFGRRVCRAFGPRLPVAYTPDSFGHVSQLPLLARGFGLDSIVFERGVGDEGERLRGEFRWLAADGETDVFAVHLLGTYSAVAALGHADWQLGDGYDARRAAEHVEAVLYGAPGDDGAPGDGRALAELPEWLRETFERLPGGILPYSTNGALILLNGSDHLFPEPNVPDIVEELNAALPGVRFVHGDIEEFIADARKPLSELECYRGEFRGSRYQHVLSGVLSSRIYLKQANDRSQTLLERYAEPLAALAWTQGSAYPDHLLRRAWDLLLQNHPHDSICGCSIDPVHEQMMVRFAGADQVAETVVAQALDTLADGGGRAGAGSRPDAASLAGEERQAETEREADTARPPEPASGTLVTVFNPLPYPRLAAVTHTLELMPGRAEGFTALDEEGRPLPSQASVETTPLPGCRDTSVDRATLRFLVSLPPLGLRTLRLGRAGEPTSRSGAATSPAGLSATEHDGGVVIENASVRLEVGKDGDVALTDRATGRRRDLRIRFEDVADAGDEYDFSPLAGDAPIVSALPCGRPALVEDGPVTATARLAYRLRLPQRLSADRSRREGESVLPLALELSLDAVGALVRLTVSATNHAEDHRLRLRVSTGCQTGHVLADGHFDVLRRPVEPPSGEGWYQAPQPTSHQRRFVAVSDGQKGLAVLNRGLPEYEAVPGTGGVDLAITLLRCVGWLSRLDLVSRPQGAGPSLPTPGAQCPGRHTFELGLLPFSGAWDESELIEQAQAFAAPPRTFPAAAATPARSWLELTRPLELTALKRADDRDSLVVRVFNPTEREVRGTLRLWAAPREAHLVSLGEERIAPLTPPAAGLELVMRPKQVTTLEVVPAGAVPRAIAPTEREGGATSTEPHRP